jgi:hypothetical protein
LIANQARVHPNPFPSKLRTSPADLHDIVEAGPHWDTVLKIEIFRINHLEGTFLTVESSQRL